MTANAAFDRSSVPTRLVANHDDLISFLERRAAQLETALESRVVIEQAKGILAERYRLDIGEAFELLRSSARSNRIRIHDLAGRVVAERTSPAEIARKVLGGSGNGALRRPEEIPSARDGAPAARNET